MTRFLAHRLALDEGIPFSEDRIPLADFLRADEAFLLGTTIEILPIIAVDDHPIADGRPGPITRQLQAAYRSAVDRWLADEKGS